MKTTFIMLTTVIIATASLNEKVASAALKISEDTVSAVMMCAPLDSASTDLKGCKEAITTLKKVAAGDPYADFYLSMAYSQGISVKSNDSTAFSYMLKAADGGDKAALKYVGAAYLLGVGTPIDVQSALTWLGKSAYAGDTDAQYTLGQV